MASKLILRHAAVLTFLALAPVTAIVAQDAPPAPQGPGQSGPPPGMPGGRGRMGGRPPGAAGLTLERLSRELAITDAQRTSINALLVEERRTIRTDLESLQNAQQALNAAIMNAPIDDGLLQAQVQQIAGIETRIALARARTQARIFQLLTPDQQSRARQLVADLEQQQGPGRMGRR